MCFGVSSPSLCDLRFFLGLFSAMALLIGAVGVYGVISYSVARRTQEYGLRMALGARRGSLLGSVLATGMRLVAFGVVAGALVFYVGSTVIAQFLYGVESRDLASFGVAAFVLAAVSVAASLAPAYRASRVDPARVLQNH